MTDTTGPPSLFQEVFDAVGGLVFGNDRELVTILRTPTPVKQTKILTADTNGCIGSGFTAPLPETIYACPMSQEAWIHRITITASGHPPGSPLTTGEVVVSGSTAGEILFWLPISGNVAPVQILEGRLSAPHLNSGEQMQAVGDSLPPGVKLRFDLQIVLLQGISEYTPRRTSPTNLEIEGNHVPGT